MDDRARVLLACGLACSAALMLAVAAYAPVRGDAPVARAERDTALRPTASQPSDRAPASGTSSARSPAQPPFEAVAAAFAPPRAPATAAAPPPRPVAAAKAPWLHSIGSVVDAQGARWLFFKDDRSGRILKLRADGVASGTARLVAAGPEGYTIETDGQLFIAGGK